MGDSAQKLGPHDLISVVVSTYERPDALHAVLRSLARQTDGAFEIVVADDGSAQATADVVMAWRAKMTAPLVHAWHEDCGFRLAEVRNLAIRASVGRYCVFLDGDCVAPPSFVAAHRALAQTGCFVTGNRVLLSQDFTARALSQDIAIEARSLVAWFMARMRGEINRIAPLITLPDGAWRRRQGENWRGARGSNMAFWRADLDHVDGFDASFSGWGREDSDIFVRLIRAGVRRKDGRFATGVLHLWHKEAERAGLAENERKLDQVLQSASVRAASGLSTLEAGSEASGSEASGACAPAEMAARR